MLKSIKSLWIPFAKKVEPGLPSKGEYAQGYPKGAVVHFTAGSYGLSELDLAKQRFYTYLLIDQHGTVHQGFPLNRWGSHAGLSSWPGVDDKAVSKHLIGIEVDCAGLLTPLGDGRYQTWWGSRMNPKDIRIIEKKTDNQKPGAYHKFTNAQEYSLIKTLMWLKENNPDVFNLDFVLGHDEVAPGRKSDPGGSLSMSMVSLREHLKARYAEGLLSDLNS